MPIDMRLFNSSQRIFVIVITTKQQQLTAAGKQGGQQYVTVHVWVAPLSVCANGARTNRHYRNRRKNVYSAVVGLLLQYKISIF